MKAILKQKTLRAGVPTASGNIYSAEQLLKAVELFEAEKPNPLVCNGKENNLDNVSAKVTAIEFDGEAVVIDVETLSVFAGKNVANMLNDGCKLAIVPTMLAILDEKSDTIKNIEFYYFNILPKKEAGFDVETIKLEIFE